MKRLALPLLVALGSWAAPALAGTETPEAARIFLSWHAPYGMPGASSNLNLAPGDTTREDTLYLTCDPGVEAPGLIATTCVLTIRAAAGDTLGPYWRFGRGTRDLRNVRVTFAADSASALLVPWKLGARGAGGVGYDYSSASGTLMVIGAVGSAWADSMRPGTRYVLARTLFRHPPAEVAGTGRPVCVEWSQAKLNLHGQRDLIIERGDRFASWNSPGCEVCRPYRGPSVPKAWKPKSRP
jgi:hypothetical protein